VRFDVAMGWFAGAVRVRMAVWPAVMLVGLNAAVTPDGTPVAVKVASWLNPVDDAREAAMVTDCPWIRFAKPGATDSVKLVEGVTVNGWALAAVPLFTNIEKGPVVARAGTVKVRLVAEAVPTGAEIVPPPCLAILTCALVPARGARFVPVTVTRFPMETDAGVKLVIVGGAVVTGLTVNAPDAVAV
jgi:hypothetical protein